MKTSTLLVSLSLLMVALSPIVLPFAVKAEVPGPPLSVTATASGTDIILEWNPPADGISVAGYRVYRGETSGTITTDLGPTTENTFTDSNLRKGDTYYYQVVAFNADGPGTPSEIVSATIQTTVPGAIDNLVATRSFGQITLSWSAPDDDGGSAIIQYSIYRSDSPNAPSSPIATQDGTGYIDRNIDAGRTYYYWVAASNSLGMGALSNMATASPLAANLPGAPTNLNAQDGIGSVVISWNAPDDDGGAEITEYRIYRATTDVKPDNPVHTNNGDVTTYTDTTDLVIGTTYYYWVAAYNSAGEGPYAGPDTAVPQEPPEVPGAPSGFLATGGAGVVNLNWTAPNPGDSPITTYNIYKASTSAMPTSPTYTTSGTSTSYNDSSVTNGLTYYYWVSAESDAGEGAATGPVTATPGTVPGTPTNLVASAGNGEVNLTWNAPSSNGGFLITEYRIYRSTSNTLPDTHTATSTTTNYRDVGLNNGQTYYYWVSAVNSKGEGQVGDMASAIPAAVPSPPRNFHITEGVGYVDLSWEVPSDPGSSPITSYSVYRGTTPNIQNPMYTLITGTTFRDSNITNGVTYYYWVSAVSSSGIGERSAVLNITPAMERTTPSVPQNLNAELQNGTVSLRWAAPSSDGGATITQYLIYRGLTENNLVLIGSATELLYNDTNTIKGVTYYYAVSAVNEEGEGARTGAYQVTVPLSSVPSVPLNLKAEMVNGNVLLSWSAPTSDGGAGITGYKIYRGTSQATLSYITSVTSTSFEDTGRRDGVTYYYTVAAVNEAGDGPSAAPVSITVPRDSVVDSPVGLVAIAGLAVVGVGSVLYLLRHNRLNP